MRLWLAQGDQAAAARWMQQQDETRDRLAPIAQELIDLARARVALARGQSDEALALLDDLLRAAEAAGRGKRCVEILVLQACAHQQCGDGLALDTLRRALALGEPEGFVRYFTDEGAPMAALLRALLADEQQRAFNSRHAPLRDLHRPPARRLHAAARATGGHAAA